MSARKPFTMRDRRRMSDRYGSRPVNDWGSGDLPAPWATGDMVRLSRPADAERLRGMTAEFYVVVCAYSIDEGDAWYFRVADGSGAVSDRLHVASADRSGFTEDVDYMAPFDCWETADPDGLALRWNMLADGWDYDRPDRCPECGQLR